VKRIITSKTDIMPFYTAGTKEFVIQIDYVAVKPSGEIDITDLVQLLAQEDKTLVSL
jgi:cysteine desulfurase